MIRKCVIILLLCLGPVPRVYCETLGGVLLKFLPGARANGMGDMFVSVSDELSAIHYNPAGIASAGRALDSMYVNGLADTDYGYVAYGHPLKKGVLGVSMLYFDGGAMDIIESGTLTGTVNAQSDFLLTMCYAGKAKNERLSIGANIKALSSSLIEEYNALAFGFDCGIKYVLQGEKIALGLSVQNIGTSIMYEETGDPMPVFIRTGASYNLGNDFLAGIDVVYPPGGSLALNIGSELVLQGAFRIRLGYKAGYDLEGITVGAGVGNYGYGIDYAFIPMSGINSSAHRLSFTWKLIPGEEKARLLYKAGISEYKSGRYRKAIKNWQKLLKIKKSNKVRKMIKKAESKLKTKAKSKKRKKRR